MVIKVTEKVQQGMCWSSWWCSKEESMVALSSCEAGYIVTSMGACQGLWFEDLMSKSKIRRGDYEDANRQQVSQLWLNILLLMKLELKYPITNE